MKSEKTAAGVARSNLESGERTAMRFNRGTQVALFGEATGARNLDVHVNILNTDSGPGPLHFHAGAENVYVVLEGRLRVLVEGEEHLLDPGDALFIPPGARHSAGNGGAIPARVLEIYSPAGPDFHIVEPAP